MEAKKARLLRRLKRAQRSKTHVALGENKNSVMHSGLSNHTEFMDKYPLNDVSNQSPSLMPNSDQMQSKGIPFI